MFTKTGCPYSARAKKLLTQKGLAFEEINVTDHPERRQEMRDLSGGRDTLPQVFFGDEHIGGASELERLDGAEGLSSHLG